MNATDNWLPILKQVSPLSSLPEAELEDIASDLIIKDFASDSIIQSLGEVEHPYLFLLLSGHVKLIESMATDTAQILSQGSFFGHYGLLRASPLPYQAQAHGQVKLALIPVVTFEKLCDRHPRIATYFESDIRVYTRAKLTLHDLSGSQFLFGTRLGDLITRPALQCRKNTTVRQAAAIMEEHNCDHVAVVDDANRPVGLVTDGLLRGKVVAKGSSYETLVQDIMDVDPVFMTDRSNLFEALLSMTQKNISHILVKQAKTDQILGVIGSSEITRGQGYNPLLVLNQIENSASLDHLADLRGEANVLLGQLYNRGVKAQSLITINTIINDALTGKVLELSQAALSEECPPGSLGWVWLSLGSEGRGEMSLKTDQDNALVYDISDRPDAKWLEEGLSRWTQHVNQSLNEVGLSLCEGGMMASNPQWCIPIQLWHERISDWLKRSQAAQIMQASAACDLRAVHGDVEMEKLIKDGLQQALKSNVRFLKHMASGVIANRPPVNAFTGRIRTLKTERGEKINLKRSGIQIITEFARILCLQAGYLDSSNTYDRLEYLKQAQPHIKPTVTAALDAYNHLNDIRLGHHLQSIAVGKQPDNWVAVNDLSDTQYQMLKAAFSSIKTVQATLRHRFNLL